MIKRFVFALAIAVGLIGHASAQTSGGSVAPCTGQRVAKTANYPVVNSDKGAVLALGGSSFFSLTFNAASGYDANFGACVINEDTGRAKYVAVSGGSSFYLWPGQSVSIYNQNNAWQVLGRSRWKLPTGAMTINTDFTNGSDVLGSTDGLATGAAAFKSVQHATTFALDQFDWNGTESGQTQLTVLMAAGSTDTTQVHFSPHSLVGAQGGASLTIDGNNGTLNVAGSAIQVYYGAVLQLRRLTITTTAGSGGGNGIEVNWSAKLYCLDGMVFGATPSGAAAINLQTGGRIELDNSFTISGGGGAFISSTGGVFSTGGAITATVSNNISYSLATVFAGGSSYTDVSNITWSLGGHTVTGNKLSISQVSVLNGSAGVPGSVAGGVASGSILDTAPMSPASGGTGTTTSVGSGSVVLATSAATTVAGQTCTLGSTCGLTSATNTLGGNVALNNISNFFDGPSAANGTAGTWFASGTVTVSGNNGDSIICKLWDGTSVIGSSNYTQNGSGIRTPLALSGLITTPAANIRISCRDITSTSGTIYQSDGLTNTASVVSAIRVN